MTTIDTLLNRNKDFAADRFAADLPLMPTLRTIIVSCADPRVDPAHVLGLELGEAVVIRNIGGRITPATMQTIGMLGTIAQVEGINAGGKLNLIVLHHTDCGITRLAGEPAMLAAYLGVSEADVDAKGISDPRAAVAVDVAIIKSTSLIPPTWAVSGLVYDVNTGVVCKNSIGLGVCVSVTRPAL
jgi:carbonic anhydrase